MTHYKTLLDPSVFIGPQDFPKDKQVVISRVVSERASIRDDGDDKKAPMMYFKHGDRELERKYKVPKSVLYGLSLMLGTDVDLWPDKTITLFAAKCLAFGEVEECVRVRFPPEIESRVKTWMKKKKANPNAYIMKESA